jgi:hypothetical protein
MPPTAFILRDDRQTRLGERLVGIELIDRGEEAARFDGEAPGSSRFSLNRPSHGP